MTEPMNPEDVPSDLMQIAMAAYWDLAYPDTAMRTILAAVLPLDRQQQREAMGLREEWRFEGESGKFIVKRLPLDDADVHFLRRDTGHPVEHRYVIGEDATEWREIGGGSDG